MNGKDIHPERRGERVAGAVGLVLALFACSGESRGPWRGPSSLEPPAGVTFVAPFLDEVDVPSSARVHVRWSEPIEIGTLVDQLRLYSPEGAAVSVTYEQHDLGKSVTLIPSQPLTRGATYELRFGSRGTPLTRFTVSPSSSVGSTNGLNLTSVQPVDGARPHLWPFTTFHLLFSEPVDPSTVSVATALQPNGTVRLVNVRSGDLIPGVAISRGNRIAWDPSEDLLPGETYRLELTDGVKDLSGEALTPASREVVIEEAPLAKQITLKMGGQSGVSGIDGRPLNTLALSSKLVGEQLLSLSGALRSDLPDLGKAGTVVPMVLRRGQALTVVGPQGEGIDLQLGAHIPTGLSTGKLQLLLLTDASGEISESPFASKQLTTQPEVRLTMDTALTAADPRANALLNQDLLALTVSGVLRVQNGQLSVELVGGAELDLLGMDTGRSQVSLAATSVPTEETPTAAAETFQVTAAFPADGSSLVPTSTAVRIFFSRPPDERIAAEHVWMEQSPGDGVPGSEDDVPCAFRQDGAMVVLTPRNRLAFGTAYVVRVDAALTSAGKGTLDGPLAQTISTRPESVGNATPPLISSMRPGVPCARQGASCAAGLEPLPEATLPANFPIEIRFSRPMNPATMVLGRTVFVTDEDGGTPAGRFRAGPEGISFQPDAPWPLGARYTLRLGGPGGGGCGQDSVCDSLGSALNTNLLEDVSEEAGGPPLVVTFTAAPPLDETPMQLELTPVADWSSNGRIDADAGETEHLENSVTMRAVDGGIVDRAYLSGSLLTSVGQYDLDRDGIPVTVAAGSWMFGTTMKIFGIDSDRLIIRPANDAVGVLKSPPASDPDRRPMVTLSMASYIDSVNDTVEQAMQREPISLNLAGRLEFAPDGSLSMALRNTNVVGISMLQGNLHLLLQEGDVRVQARGAPLKK